MSVFWHPRSVYRLKTIDHIGSWLQCNQSKHAERQFYNKYSIIYWEQNWRCKSCGCRERHSCKSSLIVFFLRISKTRKSCPPSLPHCCSFLSSTNIHLKIDIGYIRVLDPSTVVFYCDFNNGSISQISQITFGLYFSIWVCTHNLFLANS